MMETYQYTTVLTIAGSDSGGGAGIQADLKTFSALGCYGTSAITAITVQNTLGVKAIHGIPPNIVQAQIAAVIEDIQPETIKIGVIYTAEIAFAIATVLKAYPQIPVIFDPVMVSTSGYRLVESDTITTFQNTLFPLASLITPNIAEAKILANSDINELDEMKVAAKCIVRSGCKAVLIKGGHLKGNNLFDVYFDQNGTEKVFKSAYVDTLNTHGTGCTLASAIAAFMATGDEMISAIEKAKGYVQQAILAGRDVKTGEGNGPMNHFFDAKNLIKTKIWEEEE